MSRLIDSVLDVLNRDPSTLRSAAAGALVASDGLSHPTQHSSEWAMINQLGDSCWRCQRPDVTLEPATEMCRDCRLYLAEVRDEDPAGPTELDILMEAADGFERAMRETLAGTPDFSEAMRGVADLIGSRGSFDLPTIPCPEVPETIEISPDRHGVNLTGFSDADILDHDLDGVDTPYSAWTLERRDVTVRVECAYRTWPHNPNADPLFWATAWAPGTDIVEIEVFPGTVDADDLIDRVVDQYHDDQYNDGAGPTST